MKMESNVVNSNSLHQRFCTNGVWVDPALPDGFMDRDFFDRDQVEIGVWINQPFILTEDPENDGDCQFSVWCLMGEDGVGFFGSYSEFDEALGVGEELLSNQLKKKCH